MLAAATRDAAVRGRGLGGEVVDPWQTARASSPIAIYAWADNVWRGHSLSKIPRDRDGRPCADALAMPGLFGLTWRRFRTQHRGKPRVVVALRKSFLDVHNGPGRSVSLL